jgi:hypothetical protein
MATFTTRTVTSTRREWIVPAAEPWGAPAEEISKAWGAAESAYRDARGIPREQSIPGDALSFHVTDEAIVISYTIEEAA